MLVVAAVCSLGILGIELDDNFLMYFDDSFEFRRATDFMIENLRGWDVIEYSLNSGQSGGIVDPEYLAAVDRFAEWYRQQPKVVYVSTIVDTIKRLNRDMHGGDESFYRIPERRELAAQYLLLYEMSLPVGPGPQQPDRHRQIRLAVPGELPEHERQRTAPDGRGRPASGWPRTPRNTCGPPAPAYPWPGPTSPSGTSSPCSWAPSARF